MCNAECSMIGENHLMTFDNHETKFVGNCQYILATNQCPGNHANSTVSFTVSTKDWFCALV